MRKINYYVIWRQRNGRMNEKGFERYWEAVQKFQDLCRCGYEDVSMQKATP